MFNGSKGRYPSLLILVRQERIVLRIVEHLLGVVGRIRDLHIYDLLALLHQLILGIYETTIRLDVERAEGICDRVV